MHDKISSQIMFQSIKQKSSFRSFTEKKAICNLKRENFKKRKSKENLVTIQGSFPAVLLKINGDFLKL